MAGELDFTGAGFGAGDMLTEDERRGALNNALLQAGIAMMGASGWSPVKPTIGQALASGVGQGLNAYQQIIASAPQRQMQRLQLAQALQNYKTRQAVQTKLAEMRAGRAQSAEAAPAAPGGTVPAMGGSVPAMGGGSPTAQSNADAANYRQIGQIYLDAGMADEAKAYFEAADKLEPDLMAVGNSVVSKRGGQIVNTVPQLGNGMQMGADGRVGLLPGFADAARAAAAATTPMDTNFGDDYNPPRAINRMTGELHVLGAPRVPQQQQAPQAAAQQPPMPPGLQSAVDPYAPWNNLPPREANAMKARVYESEAKKLEDMRAKLAQGRNALGLMRQFGTLNVQEATGSAADKISMLPSLSSKKQEMESITAALVPLQRTPGSGATSDYEQKLYLQAVPSVSKPGDVNRGIREQYAKSLSEAERQLWFYENYFARNGHLNGADQAYAQSQRAQDVPSAAVDALRKNPGLAAQFDQKYGQGAAARALGGR